MKILKEYPVITLLYVNFFSTIGTLTSVFYNNYYYLLIILFAYYFNKAIINNNIILKKSKIKQITLFISYYLMIILAFLLNKDMNIYSILSFS